MKSQLMVPLYMVVKEHVGSNGTRQVHMQISNRQLDN